MSKMRFIKSNIRGLKRQYGMPVTLYKTTTHATVDWSLGTTSGRTTTTKTIKRAVILPGHVSRQPGPFSNMGNYDKTERDIIIDTDDIGSFGLDIKTTIRFSGSDYKVKDFQNYEEGKAYYITCSKLEGQTNES